jgi:hypothetical protein
MSSSVNIFEICKRMQAAGFEYGSIVEKNSLSTLSSERIRLESGHFFKPVKGVWFSKISESVSYEDQDDEGVDDDDDCSVALQWYDFVVEQDFRIRHYAMRSLLFAKFEETRLTNNNDPRFRLGGDFVVKTDFLAVPHWSNVSAQYAGIHVDPCVQEASDIFRTWDVDTVCIWDASAVTEMRWFKNAGTPWTYNVPAIFD